MARYLMTGLLLALCLTSRASAQGPAFSGPAETIPSALPYGSPTAAPNPYFYPSTQPQGVNGTAPPAVVQPLVTTAPASPVLKVPKVWEGNLDLGASGTDGNSETFDLHVAGKIKRTTDDDALTAEFNYHKDSTGSEATANQGTEEARYEWMFKKSPWTLFMHETLDYNQFQPNDLLLGANAGVGYRFIKDDLTALTARIGGSTSHEFGGSDDQWKPEVLAGLEFEYKINKQLKLTTSGEYTPNVTDSTDYRFRAKSALEILLSEPAHLTLKLSAIDLYDSTPGAGAKPNNLDYAALISWNF